MPVVQTNGSAWSKSSAKNDRGTVRLGGNVANVNKFKARNVLGRRDENMGSADVGDRQDVKKSNPSGTYSSMDRTKWVVRKVATTLAGVANKALQSGASDTGNRRPIAYSESDRQNYLKGFSWTADKDGMPTYTFTVQNPNVAFGNDNAARVTYTTPGKSFYVLGAMKPKTTAYSKKTVL